jgi:hypothetical protein
VFVLVGLEFLFELADAFGKSIVLLLESLHWVGVTFSLLIRMNVGKL